jgi:hypothetical protein
LKGREFRAAVTRQQTLVNEATTESLQGADGEKKKTWIVRAMIPRLFCPPSSMSSQSRAP